MINILIMRRQQIDKSSMGSVCLTYFFSKPTTPAHQPFLSLLQRKCHPPTSTANDKNFSALMSISDITQCIDRFLQRYQQKQRQQLQLSEEQTHRWQSQLHTHIKCVQQYVQSAENGLVRKKMEEDWQKIAKQSAKDQQKTNNDCPCMLKMEIQNIEVINGIESIAITTMNTVNTSIKKGIQQIAVIQSAPMEYLLSTLKKECTYVELYFPSVNTSKIRISTAKVPSTITLDIPDLQRQRYLAQVLTFKDAEQQTGYLSVRLQVVSTKQDFNMQIRQLKWLIKQMSVLKEGGDALKKLIEEGKMRESSRSSRSGLRNDHTDSFASDRMTQYRNQYMM